MDAILDIFVRVNSAGTILSKSDLLFSTIVAHWEKGREAIENFLERINKKGSGFGFDNDFMMRACLVLAECPVRLRVGSFKAGNVKLIVKNWKSITPAIDKTVDLLVEWGFERDTLPSANSVIPIAYAIKQGCALSTSKTNLRFLLIKSLLTGIYGSQGDQVLASMRKALQATVQVNKPFQLAQFEQTVRLPGTKSLQIDQEIFEDLLVASKGPRTFALLSLLTPHLKFSQTHFHQDHIHPYAGFGTAALRKLGLDGDTIREWQVKRDALPNLHLLEGKENQSKQASAFKDWLKREMPRSSATRAFLQAHHIPENVPLDLRDFDKFFDHRKEILKSKLAALLNTKSAA